MLALVVLNVIIIFLQECGVSNLIMSALDIVCSLLFVAEMVVKHQEYGFKKYWKNGWDALDGFVTVVSLFSTISYFFPRISDYGFLIALRSFRVFKMFRTARHFPGLNKIWTGFKLAMRQSAAFLLGYFIIIVVVAMFNSELFSSAAPQYFATPLDGIYAIFQMFTVEGWYEIPNAVASSLSPVWVHIIRIYFCLLLIGGGIIGMSLINSIFVDALAADNNDDIKTKLDLIEQQISDERRALDSKIEELRKLLEEKDK